MEIVFYNRNGRPVAYTQDQVIIYLYSGEPVTYLSQDGIYAFDGRHLGWFVEGRVLDHAGGDVFFTDLAMGWPARPIKLAPVPKGIKRALPIRQKMESESGCPKRKGVWAAGSSERFFAAQR